LSELAAGCAPAALDDDAVTLERLDEATLRSLLNGKLEPAAALLDAKADLLQARGDDALAARARGLAGRLRR
jgi:hypothetical protein